MKRLFLFFFSCFSVMLNTPPASSDDLVKCLNRIHAYNISLEKKPQKIQEQLLLVVMLLACSFSKFCGPQCSLHDCIPFSVFLGQKICFLRDLFASKYLFNSSTQLFLILKKKSFCCMLFILNPILFYEVIRRFSLYNWCGKICKFLWRNTMFKCCIRSPE